MTLSAAIPIAILLGLASTLHCWGMCGGILTAFTLGIPGTGAPGGTRRGFLITGFNLGRIASYALAGALAGGIGNALVLLPVRTPLYVALQLSAGFILVVTALKLGGWTKSFGWLEAAGARLWALLQPFCRRVLPVDRMWRALALGALWGWLPCGLVYSALAWSVATASPVAGGWTMLAFGAGTLPGMLAAGLAGSQLSARFSSVALRRALAVVLILAGVLGPVLSLYLAADTPLGTHHH